MEKDTKKNWHYFEMVYDFAFNLNERNNRVYFLF